MKVKFQEMLRMKIALDAALMTMDQQEQQIKTLESKLSQSVEREKKLRECVEFYGENPRWETGMSFDNGKRARQCLKQITEQKESDETTRSK